MRVCNFGNVFSLAVLTSFVALSPMAARGDMFITEWMYSGADDEFVEFTNVGAMAIDMTGWSYDDDSRTAGSVDLSAFGMVQPGESVILSEAPATDFRTAWNLAASVKVIGDSTHNLGRNDEINLYDASMALVNRLTYGDQDFPGTIRTQNASGNPVSLAALSANDPSQWVLASLGDGYGSYASTGSDLGNPGVFTIPEPGTAMLMILGAAGAALGIYRRRK